MKNTVNFSDNIIFKHNLTIANSPFLKSFNVDNHKKSNPNNKIIFKKFALWGDDKMILRAKKSQHFFIDSTFKKPKDYNQLFIVTFLDVLTEKSYPVFYAILSDKSEYLYTEVLRKIAILLDYDINEKKNDIAKTVDFEIALINAVKNIFDNIRLIGCLFHYKQNLIKNASVLGLMKKIIRKKLYILLIVNYPIL